jgi:hypothetical protein
MLALAKTSVTGELLELINYSSLSGSFKDSNSRTYKLRARSARSSRSRLIKIR